MPEYVVLLMPHPTPDTKRLAEVYTELGIANGGLKFLRCRYRPDGITLRVVWEVPPKWFDTHGANVLEKVTHKGVTEALRRAQRDPA